MPRSVFCSLAQRRFLVPRLRLGARRKKSRTDEAVHPTEVAVCVRWTSSSAEGRRSPRVETAAFALDGENHAD